MENFKRYYSERGPSFEEIDCMDPVAFYEAKGQWARDKAVHVEKVKIYHERLRDCYQREEVNFRDHCKKEINDYWQAFQLFKRDGMYYLMFEKQSGPIYEVCLCAYGSVYITETTQ